MNDAAEENVISGNTFVDIWMDNTSAYNVIAGNLIGTDVTGTVPLDANFAGIGLVHGSHDNLIGGTGSGVADTAERNVISGHNFGIYSDEGAYGNTIAGNLVGTDITGLHPLSNGNDIAISNGGDSLIEQNLVSGSFGGISINGAAATGNLVAGNLIGTDITGNAPLGNGFVGVYVTNGASDNTIGGTNPGAGNTIAFNNSGGVYVSSGSGNSILANSIHDNGGLGIDLASGTNNNQAAPVLTSVSNSGTGATITGTLAAYPSTSFRIEFFSNPTNAAGQGQTFLGFAQVTTDAQGNFTANFPTLLPPRAPTCPPRPPMPPATRPSLARSSSRRP